MRRMCATVCMTLFGMAYAQNGPPVPHHQVQPTPEDLPEPPEAQVAIAPYWVHIGEESAILAWRSKAPTTPILTWTSLEDGSQRALLLANSQQHSAHLTGLQPDQDYRWSLPNGRSGSFRTLPSRPQRRFAILGHTHGSEHFGAYSDHLLVNKVAASNPHFVIHCGDAVYQSTVQDWQDDFFQVFRPIHRFAPVYLSAGNHDSGWPFVDGLDLRPFKKLFAYPFAEEAKLGPEAAYYDLVQGPLHLLFLSYVSPLGPDSPQRRWIEATLKASRSDFRVVVLGGFNQYYDKASLHEFLLQQNVDAVFQGDGAAPGPALSMDSGFPIFTVGSANQNPDPWLDAAVQPEYLVLREMDAAGTGKKVHWIHSKKKRPALLELDGAAAESTRQQDRKGIAWIFEWDAPLSSEPLQGIQFEIQGLGSDAAYYYASVVPNQSLVETKDGFRSQYGLLESKDRYGSAPLPSIRPLRGGSYQTQRVELRIVTARAAEEIRLVGAWLY